MKILSSTFVCLYQRICGERMSQANLYVSQLCDKLIGTKMSFFQVLQRKTEEATMATKRLKELLEARKASSRDNSGKLIVLGFALFEAAEPFTFF